jgi:hypothetical protein
MHQKKTMAFPFTLLFLDATSGRVARAYIQGNLAEGPDMLVPEGPEPIN